ncbi:MAG: hypothetical protein AB1896_21400 [Thermodesulfobacteriota bacterium]
MRYLVCFLFFLMLMGPAGIPAQEEPPAGGPEGVMEPGGRAPVVPLQAVLRLPGLTPEQQGRLCAEAYELAAKVNLMRTELTNLRLKLACLESGDLDKVDLVEVKKLYAESGRLEGESFQVRQEYMKALRSILSPEQLEMLQAEREPGRGGKSARPRK